MSGDENFTRNRGDGGGGDGRGNGRGSGHQDGGDVWTQRRPAAWVAGGRLTRRYGGGGLRWRRMDRPF